MEIASQVGKDLEVGVDLSRDADTVGVGHAHPQLKETEQATRARESKRHTAQFAKNLVPFPQADARARGQICKDGQQLLQPMGGEGEDLKLCVDDPAKNYLPVSPVSIPFGKLAGGRDLLTRGGVGGS